MFKATGKRRFQRGARRLLIVAMSASMIVLASGTAAQAATSGYLIRNSNNQIMVEVWFNSGTHNMSKGRNSFTLKDHICGDSYVAKLWWRKADGVKRQRIINCGEVSFSIEPNDVPRYQFAYEICASHTTNGTGWCGVGLRDYVD